MLALTQWRAVDIAVYRPGQLEKVPLTNEYLTVAPAVVIEVDTKADLSTFSSPMDYYVSKTQALLDFGVERVIWVFTDARRTLVAAAGQDWIVQPWAGVISVIEGIGLSVAE